MAADEVPIDDWLLQGRSDPGEVASRYDAWADTYDTDLASWSYRGPVTVAETVMSRLFTIRAYDPATQRLLNRLWTKVKTGH